MSNKKKLLLVLIIIFILTLGFFVFFNKSNQSVLETYTLNRQGLMKNDKIILDEKFDEKGNLTYYKYKSPNNNEISEFNFKYKYDDNNRITEVILNNKDYIQIEYNENNKISKMYETISNSLSNNKDILNLTFNYLENDELIVDNTITTYTDTENEYKEHYTLNYKTINYQNKDCILITEKNDTEDSIIEIAYEKNLKEINFSNFCDLLNIIPLGYSTENNNLKNSQSNDNSLLLMTPMISNGNLIYIKNKVKVDQYSDYQETGIDNNYDNTGRLLKSSSYGYENNQTIHCMYKSINSKEYYEYRIVKICFFDASTEYKYIKNKIYLNENGNISKKETLESDNINEKEYTSKLKKFEKYFEKEKIYNV